MKCWKTSELPILPFLAPRVFAPWPSRYAQRRANSGLHTLQTPGTTGHNADRLERKEAAVTRWLQQRLELQSSQAGIEDEKYNTRHARLCIEGNDANGVERLERPSVRSRYLRQSRPPVREVLCDRVTLRPNRKRPVVGENVPKSPNSSNQVQIPNHLTTPVPRRRVKRSQILVKKYLTSVNEELKSPIGLPTFLRSRPNITKIPNTPSSVIFKKYQPVVKKKNISLDLKSKKMFNTYFTDQLTKRTYSRRIRRKFALIAKIKSSMSTRTKTVNNTLRPTQEGRTCHMLSSMPKPWKVQASEKLKRLKPHVQASTLSIEIRKGRKCREKRPEMQDLKKGELSEPQTHERASFVKRKELCMLPPRKARRYIVQRRINNALEARKKELRRLQKSHSRRPINTRHVTDWQQAWHRRFSLVQQNHTGFMKAWIRSPHVIRKFPIHRNSLPVRFKRYLTQLKSPSKLRYFWKKVPQPIRVKYWHDIMCYTLQRYPKAGLSLLVGTYIKPYPAGYAVGNCLDFIISYYLSPYVPADSNSGDSKCSSLDVTAPLNWSAYEKRTRLPRQPLAERPEPHVFSRLVADIVYLSQEGPRSVQLNRGSQYLLVMTLDVDSLESIYKEIPNYWSIDHLFSLVDRFAKARKSLLVLDVLRKLDMHPGVDFDSQRMHMLFSTLLRFNNRDDARSYSDAMMWDHMTSRGLKPITQHYNILIQNSFLRRESDTCWAIYNAMLEDGISPDDFTHSILLKYSKSLMDRASVHRTIGLAKAVNLQLNPFIATDHLHSIFLFYRQDYESDEYSETVLAKGRPKAFEQMLPVYCKYFDPRALALCIGPLAKHYPELNQSPPEDMELMEPPKQALTVMFIGLLYGFTEAGQVVQAYSHFRSLLSHGDPDLVARLHQSHIYDCFLMRFGKFSETVDKCPKVVEDMLTSSKSKLPSISRNENEDFYLNLVPTVYTWNILLQVYASRGQMNAGRRVLEIMQDRGIKPTEVTWATLATGYSWIQDIPGTLEAVDQLAKLGFSDYPVGVHALNKIKDTRALYAIMETREAKHQAERASAEAGKTLNMEDERVKKDELAIADELASERIQLIGEAIHDMEGRSWQKRRYWENVFQKTAVAREAAGVQPLIPDSALDGSYISQEIVKFTTVSKEDDASKVVNWTTLWNETVGANESDKTISLIEHASAYQKGDPNGVVAWRPLADKMTTTGMDFSSPHGKEDENTAERSAASDETSGT